MSECIRHHYACECRDAMYCNLVDAAREMLEADAGWATSPKRWELARIRVAACLADFDAAHSFNMFRPEGA